MQDLFIKASRMKFRFPSVQGMLTIEDLWDISLTTTKNNVASLDDVAKALSKKVKEDASESFVVKAKKTDDPSADMLEIVKHIIAVRLEDAEKLAAVKANKEKKQLIMSIMAQKQNEQLLGASMEDLERMLSEL